MKLFIFDGAWRGAVVVVAKNRHEALETIKKFNPYCLDELYEDTNKQSEYCYKKSKVFYILLMRAIYPGLGMAPAKHMIENTERAMKWISNGLEVNDFNPYY